MSANGESFGLFWDSDGGDRTYSAASFEYWLKKFFTSGVFEGDMQVTATSGMVLRVGSGYANVDGKVKFWNAPFTLTLSPANSTYPRIDTVVITRDNVNRVIKCEVVTGQYSGDAPQPTAPVRNAEMYQLVLAQIYIANGATEVTQANITDKRTDTDVCGYITGTVTEMNFEQFTLQFESYFAQFKRVHEAEWSTWEASQQAAYAAWFNLVKAQQIADKAAWDEWYADLQEELHELPPNTAEYLQIEIDELKESGTTGSIFHITTTNSELEGKDVIVTCGTERRTATFDSNLECTIMGFKSVGDVTITSTDGIQTATTTVTINCFSNYDVNIAFWLATVNIIGGETLAGYTVTVKDSNNATVGTVTLNAVGNGTFEAQAPDTYTFEVTYNGQLYTSTLEADEETTYSLALSVGFAWQIWVGYSENYQASDFTDLADVFANKNAVRELMTIHACADYLIEAVTDDIDIIDDFCANDTAMKWIGLRDYVCDGLTAINGVEAKFLASQYWERYLKDHVPTMTGNTAPYGVATSKDNGSGALAPYTSFDGVITSTSASYGAPAGNGKTAWWGFQFPTPINVKKAIFYAYLNLASKTLTVSAKIQGSNDGTNWTDIGTAQTFTINGQDLTPHEVDVPSNTDYYLYKRLELSSDDYLGVQGSYATHITSLQFYGRSLNVSVPVMTSNTAPYGEVVYSAQDSSDQAYKAFDNDDSTTWKASNSGVINAFIGYDFGEPKAIKKIIFKFGGQWSLARFVVQPRYSDDNGATWVDCATAQIFNASGNFTAEFDVSNEIHSRWSVLVSTESALQPMVTKECQFYGLDYSEREFEPNSGKKWLYDHGLELEAITTSGTVTKGSDYLTLSAANSEATATVDLTNYSILRGKVGDHMSGTTQLKADAVAAVNITSGYAPNNESLDVSAVSQSVDVGVKMTANGVCDIRELWVE